jgi:hypothetical protein
MIWLPTSDCGFSSTGFMCTEDGTRAASACSHCARPISPPSAETACVVRHVLRLERAHLEAAVCGYAAEPRHQYRFSDIGAGSLQHDRSCHAFPLAFRPVAEKP